MDLQELRDARRRDPFQPFAIRTADGRTIRVPVAEAVAVGPNILIVISEDDEIEVLEPTAIDSLRFEANGSKPKRKRGRGPGDKP